MRGSAAKAAAPAPRFIFPSRENDASWDILSGYVPVPEADHKVLGSAWQITGQTEALINALRQNLPSGRIPQRIPDSLDNHDASMKHSPYLLSEHASSSVNPFLREAYKGSLIVYMRTDRLRLNSQCANLTEDVKTGLVPDNAWLYEFMKALKANDQKGYEGFMAKHGNGIYYEAVAAVYPHKITLLTKAHPRMLFNYGSLPENPGLIRHRQVRWNICVVWQSLLTYLYEAGPCDATLWCNVGVEARAGIQRGTLLTGPILKVLLTPRRMPTSQPVRVVEDTQPNSLESIPLHITCDAPVSAPLAVGGRGAQGTGVANTSVRYLGPTKLTGCEIDYQDFVYDQTNGIGTGAYLSLEEWQNMKATFDTAALLKKRLSLSQREIKAGRQYRKYSKPVPWGL